MTPKDFRHILTITWTAVWLLLGLLIGCYCNSSPKDNTKDVTRVIDSLKHANNRITIKLQTLDSIKNEKVIEVASLDNDSTLKLFYELLSE